MGPTQSTDTSSTPTPVQLGERRSSSGLRWTRRRLIFAVLPLLLLAATYAAATIDIRNHDGRVLRGVVLGDVDVGGMSAEELDIEFDRINSFISTTPVYIETPGAAYQIDAERLGLALDRRATQAALLDSGRSGTSVLRPFGWLGALVSKREVDAILRLDASAAEAGLAAVSKTISVQPGEPILILSNGRLQLEPGTAGSILDVPQLVRDLSASLPSEPGQEIFVDAVTTTDSMIDVDIQALVDLINGQTRNGVEFVVNGTSIQARRDEFRSWVELDLAGDEPRARLNAEVMYRWINAAAGIAQGDIDTRALIVEGAQIRLPVANAIMCCQADVAEQVFESVLSGTTTINLELIADDLTPLADLGISELIGEFTTEHPADEDRVINIQRMADIVRGAVIEPGDTFSLNSYVGERTTAKGFVPAGVIYDGVFDEDVGGGVSQFATTLFNASFFGGLDFVEYQPHSIYIDRYPFGREATVNWPTVDLRIRNPSDFPVLIWTEYTPTTITVKLFGTATVSGAQTDQTTEPLNECTKVRTERTRTYADGREEVDYVGATYQPSEGRDCDGNPTEPVPGCEDSEGLVDSDDDGFGDLCVPIEAICSLDTTPVDEDDDGLIDYCSAEECPADTKAVDTNGDGNLECLALDAEPDDAEPDDAEPDDPTESDAESG